MRLIYFFEDLWYVLPGILVKIIPGLYRTLYPSHYCSMSRQDVTYCCFKIKSIISHFFPEAGHLPVIIRQLITIKSCGIQILTEYFRNKRCIDMVFINRKPVWTLVRNRLKQICIIRNKFSIHITAM